MTFSICGPPLVWVLDLGSGSGLGLRSVLRLGVELESIRMKQYNIYIIIDL